MMMYVLVICACVAAIVMILHNVVKDEDGKKYSDDQSFDEADDKTILPSWFKSRH